MDIDACVACTNIVLAWLHIVQDAAVDHLCFACTIFQCSKHTDLPSKTKGQDLLGEAITVICVQLSRTYLLHTYEKHSVSSFSEGLRSFSAEETADVRVHAIEQCFVVLHLIKQIKIC